MSGWKRDSADTPGEWVFPGFTPAFGGTSMFLAMSSANRLEVGGTARLSKSDAAELAKVLAHYSKTGELLLPDEIGEPEPSQGDREQRATLEMLAEAVGKLALRADKVDDQLEKLFDGDDKLAQEVDARFDLNHQRHSLHSSRLTDHGNDLLKLFAEFRALEQEVAAGFKAIRREVAALRHDLANAEEVKLLAGHLAERGEFPEPPPEVVPLLEKLANQPPMTDAEIASWAARLALDAVGYRSGPRETFAKPVEEIIPTGLPTAPPVVISSPLHRAMHSEAKQSTSERLAAAADPQSAEEQAEGELGGGAL